MFLENRGYGMANCLFCKIALGEIDSDTVYENENVMAFRDLRPQAPVHILVIPKKHIATVNDFEDTDKNLIGDLYLAAKEIAIQEGIAEDGYRTVINCNENGGQEVFHVHLHILGGREMRWPPG